jgi:hypothetical protein
LKRRRYYGRAQLHDLGKAVGRLPDLTADSPQSPELKATGTDSAYTKLA